MPKRTGTTQIVSPRKRRRIMPAKIRTPRGKDPGYVDLGTAGYALDTTGSITLLNVIPQGASQSQRVGKRVLLKGLQCRGYMDNNATATTNHVTYLVVYDKRPDGALPAITDILEFATSTAMNNNTNAGRFRILKRVDTNLNGSAANNYAANTSMDASFYIDLKGKPMVFNAVGTGVIADIAEGALYFVTVGSRAAGTTAAELNAIFRVTYVDN